MAVLEPPAGRNFQAATELQQCNISVAPVVKDNVITGRCLATQNIRESRTLAGIDGKAGCDGSAFFTTTLFG